MSGSTSKKRKSRTKDNEQFRIDQPLFYLDECEIECDIEFDKLSEKELYENVSYPQARTILIYKYKHNPSFWLNQFHHSTIPKIKAALRILIARDTIKSLEKQKYFPTSSPSTPVDIITHKKLLSIAKSTKYYTQDDISTIKCQYNQIERKDDYKVNSQNHDIDDNDDNDYDIVNDNEQENDDNNDDNDDDDNDYDIDNDNDNENNDNGEEKNESKNMIKDENVFCINADCIDVGCLLQNRGYNPVILNMANQNRAGGGWERGSGAQEENIFRRSVYAASLCNTIKGFENKHLLDKKRKWSYPMDEFGCIYSPNVYILRSNESSGYKYLKCPYTLSFIAGAMYRFPKIDEETRRYKDKDIEENIRKKIRSLLRVCYENGHDCLVMSAWGCGAFRNPPEHQAELWYQVLNEKEFKNVFGCICFAILDDHNTRKQHNPEGNFAPFASIFGESKLLELY